MLVVLKKILRTLDQVRSFLIFLISSFINLINSVTFLIFQSNILVGILSRESFISSSGPSDYNLNAGNLAFESEKRYKYSYAKKMKPQVYLDAISYCEEEEEEEEYYTPRSPKRIEETKTLVHHVAFKSKVERFPEVQKVNPYKEIGK